MKERRCKQSDNLWFLPFNDDYLIFDTLSFKFEIIRTEVATLLGNTAKQGKWFVYVNPVYKNKIKFKGANNLYFNDLEKGKNIEINAGDEFAFGADYAKKVSITRCDTK